MTTTPPVLLKSLLFVPGDSEKKMAKAQGNAASALILDLEDSVSIDRIDVRPRHGQRIPRGARGPLAASNCGCASIRCRRRSRCPTSWRVVRGGPDGIMLPKIESAADIVAARSLPHRARSARGRDARSHHGFIPVATETPQAMFAIGGPIATCRRGSSA